VTSAPVLDCPAIHERPSKTGFSRSVWTTDRLVLLAVLGAAVAAAGFLYWQFLETSRSLWGEGVHDRNAHYLFALRLATDLRRWRIVQFIVDLDSARVWPPLYGVLASVVLLVGGLDYRLAVLPSLAAWTGTVVFGFLLARRAVPRGGNVAGLVAALFIAASPAHRAYATDIMLESTGACLSLAALYCYLVSLQGRSLAAGRWLGLALSALFLLKYNYWLLAILALTASTAVMYRRQIPAVLRRVVAAFDWRNAARTELREPLNYVLAGVLLLIAGVYLHGDRPFIVGGATISLYPPHNITHVAYILVFVRLARWWFMSGRERIANLPLRVRQLTYWHVVPMAVWFLLPKRLGYFLWYLSPANAEPGRTSSFAAGLADYARWAVNDYHVGVWSAVTVGVLVLAALASCRSLRPGGAVVLWLVLFGTFLGSSHPNRKGRFLHSWLAASWVAAGVGVAGLTYGSRSERWRRLQPWLAGAALGSMAVTHLPGLAAPAHAQEGGPHVAQPSLLELTDYYLGELTPTHRLVLLTTMDFKPLAQWTYLERFGSLDGMEDVWYGFGPAGGANREGFRHWLGTTDCDTIVVCESLPGATGLNQFGERDLHREMIDVLANQTIFTPVARRELAHLSAAVTVWRHRSAE
jgi:hypothetical protein